MIVHEIDHIVLRCADVEESLRWYQNQLGLKGVRVDEWRNGEAGFPSVRISPGFIIDLFGSDEVGGSKTKNLDHFCLVVDRADVDAVVSDPAFNVVDGPGERFGARGQGWSVYVTDPDANVVELRSYSSTS